MREKSIPPLNMFVFVPPVPIIPTVISIFTLGHETDE